MFIFIPVKGPDKSYLFQINIHGVNVNRFLAGLISAALATNRLDMVTGPLIYSESIKDDI